MGVGQSLSSDGVPSEDEDAFASVGSSDVGRAKTRPFRIEPEAGQIGEHDVEATSQEPSHVLQEEDARSKLAKHAGELVPEAGLGVLEPGAGSGIGEAGAGESADDGVDGLDVGARSGDVADVAVDRELGVLAPDDLAAERRLLAGPPALGSEHVLEGAVEAEDARERRAIRDHAPIPRTNRKNAGP